MNSENARCHYNTQDDGKLYAFQYSITLQNIPYTTIFYIPTVITITHHVLTDLTLNNCGNRPVTMVAEMIKCCEIINDTDIGCDVCIYLNICLY